MFKLNLAYLLSSCSFRRFEPRRCKPEWGRGLGVYHSIQPVSMNFRLTYMYVHWVAAAEQLCRGDNPR